MSDGYLFDPSSLLTAFFELPRWTQIALPVMAAALVLMNSILGTALWSRRRALLRVEELAVELTDVKARLISETRWRLADEKFGGVKPEVAAIAAGAHSSAARAS